MADFYLQKAFEELLKDSGLCIMARGCGLKRLLVKFIQHYSTTPSSSPSSSSSLSSTTFAAKKLVFVINAKDEEQAILDTLMADGLPPTSAPHVITFDTPIQERIDMYLRGGVFIVTSRILIVDLLNQNVNPLHISGMLVANAHKVTLESVEAFILRVYREHNRTGFIRAFSEDPEPLSGGLGKLERVMKLLWVKQLSLWPRFKDHIMSALVAGPDVSELSTQLTSHMRSCMQAILVALKNTLDSLRKGLPTVDTSGYTVEMAIHRSFDYSLRQQLDPKWHSLGFSLKQNVADVKTLRAALEQLHTTDCVSFYYSMLAVRKEASGGGDTPTPSAWLLSMAAEQLYTSARDAVYTTVPIKPAGKDKGKASSAAAIDATSTSSSGSSSGGGGGGAGLRNSRLPSVDEIRQRFGVDKKIVMQCAVPPKWTLFLHVLNEIKVDYNESRSTTRTRGRVLVVVRDQATAHILRECATRGPTAYNESRFRWFVAMQSAEIRRRARGHTSDRHDRGGKRHGHKHDKQERATKHQLQELELQQRRVASDPKAQEEFDPYGLELMEKQLRALNAEAMRMLICERELRDAWEALPQVVENRQGAMAWATVVPASKDGKRAGQKDAGGRAVGSKGFGLGLGGRAGGSKRARTERAKQDDDDMDDNEGRAPGEEADDGESEDAEEFEELPPGTWGNPVIIDSKPGPQDSPVGSQGAHSQTHTASLLDPSLHLTIASIDAITGGASYIDDIAPAYVVLYDTDVTVMRMVEVYHANSAVAGSSLPPLRVFLLSYENSLDEARYIAALAREKRSFEHLIETKRTLAICLPDILERGPRDKDRDLTLSLDTRTVHRGASGELVKKVLTSLVVDIREFRSMLPSQLYQQGLTVIPRTLAVADYVLAAEICVERKSVSDLFGSFQSGRLFNQAESMSKHYRYPCLLVEFTETAPFCLQPAAQYTSDVRDKDISSQLSALVLAFPQLRILWSRTIHATPDIFSAIAAGHDPVDERKAIEAGAAAALDGDSCDAERQETDAAVRNMLLSLPGVGINNLNIVMDLARDLCELSALDEDTLSNALGQANGRALFQFFRKRGTEESSTKAGVPSRGKK